LLFVSFHVALRWRLVATFFEAPAPVNPQQVTENRDARVAELEAAYEEQQRQLEAAAAETRQRNATIVVAEEENEHHRSHLVFSQLFHDRRNRSSE